KIIRDITERKRVEAEREVAVEKLTTILESITDAFFAMDRDWRVTYFNHQAELLLGRSRNEVLGQSVWELYPDAVGSRFEQECRLALSTDQPVSFEEYYPSLDKWIDVRAYPSRDGIAVYFRDTTARRAAEAGLKQREEQLRQAQKMEAVGQLAGGIAHDFNNLLTAITGYAGLLLRQFDESDARRGDVLEIRRAAERAGTLTQQLLAFSRRQVTQPRLLNLNSLLEDLSRLLVRLLGEHINVVLELSPEVGSVRADPGQMEQVIVNLAVNARDAMPEGGTLTISTAARAVDETAARAANSTPGAYVALTVRDTGHGFDPGLQERIFEPFFTTKGPGKGTGLGLSTVYGIVRQAGGTVTVTSAPGEGAAFSILLPEAAEPAEATTVEQDQTVVPGTETVLLVEDEPAVRGMAARALREFGYNVVVAADGPDALELGGPGQQQIDLLLTDVALPHLSGRIVAERLLEQRPGMRVLFMSGYTTDPAVMAAAADRGRFIQKPFTPEALLTRVRAVLDEPA
ncbi:MAG TPA: ATP-binding protein, partial [Gemmatimonadales bacterium]|nr:ATP-binding protein [Gemmatimonadales bacterium]